MFKILFFNKVKTRWGYKLIPNELGKKLGIKAEIHYPDFKNNKIHLNKKEAKWKE